MKNWLLVVLMVLSCSFTYIENTEKVETLSSKVILQNTNGYFVLSDRSCWKVLGFSKRWRSISEWWNDVQLVPQNYECVPNDWLLGAQMSIYPKFGHLEVDEANAANRDELKQCTHLLVNMRTGQILFAMALEPADCIIKLFNDAHVDGYNKGLGEGNTQNSQNATRSYNQGRTDGYSAGYAKGFQDAQLLRPYAPLN